MKLLYCPYCNDVFQLRVGTVRTCECGECKGKYDDNAATAVTNGKGIDVAIGNGSLADAVVKMRRIGIRSPDRSFYPVMCWVRPSSGPTNPHSRVQEDL